MSEYTPGAGVELKKLNYRHEAILIWLLENPDRKLGDCARELNYTQAWLSTVINSDMFQELYKRRCEERGQIAIHSTINRLGRISALALEQIERKLEAGAVSEKFLLDVSSQTLDRLGFSKPTAEQAPHVHFHVDANDLIAARERSRARFEVVKKEDAA